jgi:hypothetical protein
MQISMARACAVKQAWAHVTASSREVTLHSNGSASLAHAVSALERIEPHDVGLVEFSHASTAVSGATSQASRAF